MFFSSTRMKLSSFVLNSWLTDSVGRKTDQNTARPARYYFERGNVSGHFFRNWKPKTGHGPCSFHGEEVHFLCWLYFKLTEWGGWPSWKGYWGHQISENNMCMQSRGCEHEKGRGKTIIKSIFVFAIPLICRLLDYVIALFVWSILCIW